jgi:hypothetical protein
MRHGCRRGAKRFVRSSVPTAAILLPLVFCLPVLPPHARFGNWLTARLMKLLYALDVTELGPYRPIRTGLLQALDMQEMAYGWPTEMIVKAARRSARLVEIRVR